MERRSSDLRPALVASAALHLAIVLLALVAMRLSPPVKPISVTAVTLVTSPGPPNQTAALQAPERHAAAAPTPSPAPPSPAPVDEPAPEPTPAPTPPAPHPTPRHHHAAPEPIPAPEPTPEPAPQPRPKPVHRTVHHPAPERVPAPEPTPKPEPKPAPKPKPTPKPTPRAAPSKPAPEAKPAPAPKPKAKPAPELDLTTLAKAKREEKLDLTNLAKSSKSSREQKLNLSDLTRAAPESLNLTALAGGRRGAAARGAVQAETDRQARQAAGAANALTGDQLGALMAKIIPLWHLNCDVQGASKVVVKVEMRLTADHHLAGPPRLAGVTSGGASEDVVAASAQRALTAVAQGAPYSELPASAPRDFILAFHAKDACGGG